MKINEITQDKIDVERTINKDCSQWLKESNGHHLWRGITKKINMKKFPTAKNRPSTSDFELMGMEHDIIYDGINTQLLKWHGLNRANTTLFSGNKINAGQYGKPHVGFPLNGYKYLWSPGVHDYALKIMDYWERGQDNGKYLQSTDEDNMEVVEWFLNEYPYQSDELIEALQGNVEIMIYGSFYLVDKDLIDYSLLDDPIRDILNKL